MPPRPKRRPSSRPQPPRLIASAVTEQEQGAEAVQRAAQLEAERGQLLDTIADLDGKLAARRAERELAAAELAAAEAAADIAGTKEAGGTLAAAGKVLASLADQRHRAAERLVEVGDGTGHTGEHGRAEAATAGEAPAPDPQPGPPAAAIGAPAAAPPAVTPDGGGWLVPSSSGNGVYRVTAEGVCSCPAGQYRRACRHVAAVRQGAADAPPLEGVVLDAVQARKAARDEAFRRQAAMEPWLTGGLSGAQGRPSA